jgi:peptidyl-dipeptidase Dcp
VTGVRETSEVDAEGLLAPWPGPYGGLPPFDQATPERIERAMHLAIDRRREDVTAIVDNPNAATFENTVLALEKSGRAFRRVETLRAVFASTRMGEGMVEADKRLAPLITAIEDEIAQNSRLFTRIEAVLAARSALEPDQAQLVERVHRHMLRRGAALTPAKRAELTELNGRIARLQAEFQSNLSKSGDEVVWAVDAGELEGLPASAIASAAKLADDLGKPGIWAIRNTRAAVWSVLQFARSRTLRQRVRDMWVGRCAAEGACDNRALVKAIVTLRGKAARLLGYPTFAHMAVEPRMAKTPEAALDPLMAIWAPVRFESLVRLKDLQVIADADGLGEPIQAWDYLFYREAHRRMRLGFDSERVREYLEVNNVLAALFDAMGRLHQVQFRELNDVARVHPDVRVFEVSRDGSAIGVIYADLLAREGKMPSSWQYELRTPENIDGRVIGLSNVCTNFQRGPDGEVLLGWEYANVLFHEFGHALHMLFSRARYPSLGSMQVAWDVVELPSQLNERWLFDPPLLKRHMRHHRSGAAMPDDLIQGMIRVREDERVASLNLDFLAPAIVDMRMHLAANGEAVDPIAIEQQIYDELGMPEAIDAVFRIPCQHHSFTSAYAAGIYSYLWADVLVADVLEAFGAAEGGLYDAAVAEHWRNTVLTVGASVPAETAFRHFRGRDPDPEALLRRFQLGAAA